MLQTSKPKYSGVSASLTWTTLVPSGDQGRGVATIGHKWGNFGLCCCGWQTVGSALDEKSFTVSRTGQTGILWCPFRDQKGNSGLQDEGVGITLAAYMHVSRSWVYCRKILVYCRLQFWT